MNENNNNRPNQQEDDGSLSFLAIPQDEGNKHFNCRETTQQKLINLTFWVCDYIEGVKTKFGAERFLVKIKRDRDDKDADAEKFFTNFLWVSCSVVTRITARMLGFRTRIRITRLRIRMRTSALSYSDNI